MEKYTFDADLFSDLYKDANGFSPGPDHEFYSAADGRKQEIWDRTLTNAHGALADEKTAERESVENFEDLVGETMGDALGRKDAILLIFEMYGITPDHYDDPGYVCHLLGVPFSYEEEFSQIIEIQKLLHGNELMADDSSSRLAPLRGV